MLFTKPTSFREALQSREVKSALPTTASSLELSNLPVEIRERALFSARTLNADYLQTIDDLITQIIDGSLDTATTRLQLKEALDSISYQPAEGEAGTIKDLSSDQRLNLVIKTNTEMAQGYGYWMQGQDPELLDQWPAQELFRAEARKEPRDWHTRWLNAAGEIGDDVASSVFRKTGRMVARKDSEIWVALSAFGQPYPPFDFNSGMDIQDVSREDAIALGVIDRDTQVQPQDRGFNDNLETTPEVRSADLRQALLDSVGDQFEFQGDVLVPK